MSIWKSVLGASLLQSCMSSALAQDVHEGQWQYTTKMQMPAMPELPESMKLPDGLKLPEGLSMGGRGMSFTSKSCVTKATLVPPARDDQKNCKLVDQQRKGNEVTWRIECNTDEGHMVGVGKASYGGEQMASTMTMTGTMDGHPINTTMIAEGHYLGACPAK